MGDIEDTLTQAFIDFGKHFTRASVIIEGVISEIDESAFTCTVDIVANINGGPINTSYSDIPLKVLKNSQASIIEIPVIGSNCLICFKDNDVTRPQLLMNDTCSKLLIKIGDTTAEFNTGKDSNGNDIAGIQFNGGSNYGLVLVDKLITKINTLENTLNTFMNTTFNTHTHAVPSLGTSLVPVPLNTVSLNLTKKEDIQNKKITQ